MSHADEHVLELVDAYLHDALSTREVRRVEEHCKKCKICQVALREARERFLAIKAVPPVEASDKLIEETCRRVTAAPRRRMTRAAKFWSVMAVAASLLIGATIYYNTLSPSPYNLRILGQTDLLAGSEASVRVMLTDHGTGEPYEGIPVEIDLIGSEDPTPIRLATFTTDRFGTGSPRMQLPDSARGDYRLRVRADVGRVPEAIERSVTLVRSWRLMLSTDKPVYQPGQTIRVRSLALRRVDGKPVAGRDAVFSVSDPKGNVILRQRDATSRFGIASIDCPLADEILEGPYRVECRIDETTSAATVDVQKYVLPKFKIDLATDRPYYEPGGRLRGTLQVDYFFGKPVADAPLEILVRRVDGIGEVVERIAGRTDADGKAPFECELPRWLIGREQDSGNARVELTATVRDSAGQEETKSISRLVAADPIRIEVVAESGSLVAGVSNTVYIFTSYPDGRPVETRLAMTGQDGELRTNRLGLASFEITPGNDRVVSWSVRATDEEGKSARREVALPIGKPGLDFLVRTDKAVYDGGETMHLLVLGGGVEPVLIDLIKDGQTLLTDTVEMADGKGTYQIDLPAGLAGTLELTAYRYGPAGLPVTKSRVVHVRHGGGVRVRTEFDREQYRPGEQAKVTFRLVDDRGRPAPGALSLAAVDEAVFSVLPQSPGLQAMFSSLEQELLKPIYAIYPWSPNLSLDMPPEEQERFENALFTLAGRDAERQAAVSFRQPVSHTLDSISFPAKASRIERVQREGLRFVRKAWAVFAGVAVVGVLVIIFSWTLVGGLIATGVVLLPLALIGLLAMLGAPAGLDTPAMFDTADAIAPSAEFGGEVPIARSTGMPATDKPVRVRQWFPETLLWRPELITDNEGVASLEIDLADSITTWRLTAGAVTPDGALGGGEAAIRVFQPFFVELDLPVSLTRGDEVTVPAVVYNYLDRPQAVDLRLADGDWFTGLDESEKTLELAAGEVRSVGFPLRVTKVGRHELHVEARGSDDEASQPLADAIKRSIEVVPDGRRVEQVVSGTLQQPGEMQCDVPEDAIEGSVRATVKIHPSSFSQLVEGLDAVFQRPYGCFEQTSSTTYPNVLALDYLRRTGKSLPEVEAKARQYIHLGYQRLLSFEIDGGGFDWFGRPPANRTLTAYGLMEFVDMARVHDVDTRLIDRTRRWLLDRQQSDGSWTPEDHRMHDDPTGRDAKTARLRTTAYIAWAVFAGAGNSDGARDAAKYLLTAEPASIDDPYLLALIANALSAIDPDGTHAARYVERLEAMKQTSADGKLVWWEMPAERRTTFYGSGDSGQIEATALATLAMIRTGHHPESVRGALAWLIARKDAGGTWHSTQATVLALKALLAGTGKTLGGDGPRAIEISVDNRVVHQVTIPADQAEVMRRFDLAEHIDGRTHRVQVTERSDTASGYQIGLSYHVPEESVAPAEEEPLAIEIQYDRSELTPGDIVTATAVVTNRMEVVAPMVILDLPIPAGFALEGGDLAELVEAGAIAKYQSTARSAVVYLRDLPPNRPLELRYRLRATMPVNVEVRPATVYEYYDPAKRAAGRASRLVVLEKP